MIWQVVTVLARSNNSRDEHLAVEDKIGPDVLPIHVKHGIGCCRDKRIQSQAHNVAGPARRSFNGHAALGIITDHTPELLFYPHAVFGPRAESFDEHKRADKWLGRILQKDLLVTRGGAGTHSISEE